MVWKVEELPLSHKIFYGALFIPLSLFLFCGILFQVITDYSFTFILYLLITGQLLLIMISDAAGDKTVRKLRFGRMFLYSIGFAIGIISIVFLYLLFTTVLILGNEGSIRVDRLSVFGIIGTIIFILSLWGFKKEEKYGTEGKMKGTVVFWATIVLWALSIPTITCGASSIIDLIVFQQYGYHLLINIGIYPNYNFLAGVVYLPIGVLLFILSLRKMRRDHRYRKQFY